MEIDDDARKLIYRMRGRVGFIHNWYRCRDVCMAVSAALYMTNLPKSARQDFNSFEALATHIPRVIPNDVIGLLPKV